MASGGPFRRSVSVRLEEGAYRRLRRHSLESGVPTSALVRSLVHRWIEEQGNVGVGESPELDGPEGEGTKPDRLPGLFG